MERLRQLVGEMLLYCFAVVVITGAFLAYFYSASGEQVAYDGSYAPLRGVMMSEAYSSALKLSFDAPGGLLIRQLHHSSAIVLLAGAVVWVVLGELRYVLAYVSLGLVVVAGISGYGAVDDLLSGTFLGKVPVVAWYGLHLATALALGAALVVSSRREAAERPRSPRLIALSIVLAALAIFWL
ncbi:hypothetical protein [Nonomuraea sp. SYSU D8015]|uniref:hypothetical protein n=1 Tax=Nonomuraea sp. SYSU D8015 TaxID=2593644 RepID=UPI001660DD1E|nr:hypothetical protein [Nonomuraea sp. SYSU D8015]